MQTQKIEFKKREVDQKYVHLKKPKTQTALNNESFINQSKIISPQFNKSLIFESVNFNIDDTYDSKQMSISNFKPSLRDISSPIFPKISQMAIKNLSNTRNHNFVRGNKINNIKDSYFLKKSFNQSINIDQTQVHQDVQFMKSLHKEKTDFQVDTDNFDESYKSLDKILEQNSLEGKSSTATVNMIQTQFKFRLMPSKMGLGKQNKDEDTLNISFGDQRMQALPDMVQENTKLKKLILKNNNITFKGSSILERGLSRSINILDISCNRIGQFGCIHLNNFLRKTECNIMDINVEANQLGSENINILLTGIKKNNSLKKINLSNNRISDDNCDILGQVMYSKVQIQEIYLHWNRITSKGGENLFTFLENNQNIMVLDLSWNLMNDAKKGVCQFIENNSTMIHLDLSFNKFDLASAQLISQSLLINKTIYGFHFAGMKGYVDNLQFLILDENSISQSQANIRRINGVNIIQSSKLIDIHGQRKETNVCWICDGWCIQEFLFSFSPADLDQESLENENITCIFIHFQFEQYSPRYIGNAKTDNTLEFQFIVPNKDFYFFYSIQNKPFFGQDSEILSFSQPQEISVSFQAKKVHFSPDKLNVRYFNTKNSLFFPKTYTIKNTTNNEQIKPRTNILRFSPNQVQDKVWQKKDSIFKNFIDDSTENFRVLFDYDMNTSNIQKRFLTQIEYFEAKDILRNNYKMFYEAFTQFCSRQSNKQIFSIDYNTFADVCKDSNITLTPQELNSRLSQTFLLPSNEFKKSTNGEEGIKISRSQFIEFIFRCFDTKQLKKIGQTSSTNKESIFILCSLLKTAWKSTVNTGWREKQYYSQATEIIYIYYHKVLNNIFSQYHQKDQQDHESHITLESVHDICKDLQSRFKDLVIPEQKVNLFFLQSKMLIPDNIFDVEQRSKMFFLEYLEFIGRLATFLNLPQLFIKEELTTAQRTAQPTFFKIESLCYKMYYLGGIGIQQQIKQIRKSLVSQYAFHE